MLNNKKIEINAKKIYSDAIRDNKATRITTKTATTTVIKHIKSQMAPPRSVH